MQIALAAILPLLAGLIHPRVREAIAGGHWPTAAGLVLGFNGLFAVIAVIAVALASRKRAIGTCWYWIGSTALLSGACTVFGPMIRERVLENSDQSATTNEWPALVNEVNEWTATVGRKISFTLSGAGLATPRTWRYYPNDSGEAVRKGLIFEGQIQNNTPEKLEWAVIDYHVVNKAERSAVVLTKRLALSLNIFPTANVAIKKVFIPLAHGDDGALAEIHEAMGQLGSSGGWSYELVALVPQRPKLEFFVIVKENLKIDALMEQVPD